VKRFTVGVRELAQFCFRRGDIDYRFTPSPTAAQGIEGHQHIARNRPATYQAEYAVEEEFSLQDCQLLVRGRADGFDPGLGLVEEVKTCRVDFAQIPDVQQALHRAQARLYGALLCRALDLPGLDVRLTYWNIDREEEWQQCEQMDAEALEDVLKQALQYYGDWIKALLQCERRRDASIASLEFPHGLWRAGQREMAETVYKCIDQRGQLLLQAPTGIGKTAAVLYPAAKALAAGKHQRVVYLTARTVGRRAAEQTLDQFRQAGLSLRSLSLSAREQVCLSPGKACHGEDCPYALGYYDRLPAAMAAAREEQSLNREVLERLALEHTVCPYQLAADMLPWVDVVIADINYVYSFHAMVSSIMDGHGLAWSVLLDEAHNLPDRARDMYGAWLHKAKLMAARKQCQGPVRKALDRCNRVLLALQKEPWQETDFDSTTKLPDSLLQVLQGFAADVSAQMGENPVFLQQRQQLADFYFEVLQLMRVAEVFGPEYRFERYRGQGKQDFKLRLNCLDASRLLQQRQQAAHSVTAFSATVSPSDWVAPALGFQDQAVFMSLPSPFQSDQLAITLDTRIDTRYRAREQSMPLLCETIRCWLGEHSGNCIVYFPSYRYLEDSLAVLQGQLGERTVCVQQRSFDETRRQQLLQMLAERRNVVAFCILGGVFGEGIDLPGDQLSSVVVVGVGLPQFNREREVLKDYYSQCCGRGFEYAYQYPGMQKVNQALGRVVRRDSDRGQVLLLDSRYSDPGWRALLPDWWEYR
jgi:DNA excision repair protein ERCC-2